MPTKRGLTAPAGGATISPAGHSGFNLTDDRAGGICWGRHGYSTSGGIKLTPAAATAAAAAAERSLQQQQRGGGGSDGWPSDCPLGFICSLFGDIYPCKLVQEKAITVFNFGGIHDGMYCPANSSYYENCPIGFYCPTVMEKVPCPAGFFCPHKTAKPEIICKDCKEQSTDMTRAAWGGALLVSVAGLILVLYIASLWKHWYKKRKERLHAMEQRFITADRERVLKQRERDQLERIRPQLEEIAERLHVLIADQDRRLHKQFSNYELELVKTESTNGEDKECYRKRVNFQDDVEVDNWKGVISNGAVEEVEEVEEVEGKESQGKEGHKKEFIGIDMDGNLWFDADILFDTLDVDESGDLSYEELNSVLHLSQSELHHFLHTMNELGGIDSDIDGVRRQVFIENFLEALEVSSNYRVSEKEAAKLFDEIARAHGGGGSNQQLDASLFFGSQVNRFMSEAQINELVKGIRDRKGATQDVQITKAEFVQMYPELLKEVRTCRDLEDFREESRLIQGFDIAFSNLSLSVQVGGKSVNVVDNLTGRLQARTMTALMGGSGAGKTSLLNTLCGRASYGEASGTVWINGHEATIKDHLDSVGYVPQDDIVYPELTVRENLLYSGRFQLRAGTPRREIEDLVDETLANLGLTSVKDSRVGEVGHRGVSGGERKRVNIGIELMRKPSILFLDEPTSGLDSSSAMLLVKCLKGLVDTRGITVCSVIHQPRKYIFDMFDSLILLCDGGRIVYEGPTSEAEEYFSKLNYVLPGGEGVADWLIDISSGRLRPLKSERMSRMSRIAINQSYYQKTPASPPRKKTAASTGNTIEKNLEKAKIARENLGRCWNIHFSNAVSCEREQYLPPKAYPLPDCTNRPGFVRQLHLQIRRNFRMMSRNWKIVGLDTLFIVGAVALISALEGGIQLTQEDTPIVPYDVLVSDDADVLVEYFPALFAYATKASVRLQEYALKVGVITAVLVGLAASRAVTDKRLQFYREAASGYNTTAFFLAFNITSTIEHGLQILLCVIWAYWLRDSAVPFYSYFFNFILLAWLCISWSFLLSILVPPKNTTIVIGFFMAFFGLLFSGGLSPVLYSDIYNPDRKALAGFCGLVSPTRYFIEAMAVAEHRSLPSQSGFTYISEVATQFPADSTSFDFLSLAQNDSGVVVWSDRGWYWSALPAVMVGLAIRIIAAGIITFRGKGQATHTSLVGKIRNQMAKPFWDQCDLLNNIFFWIAICVVIIIWILTIAVWLILRET